MELHSQRMLLQTEIKEMQVTRSISNSSAELGGDAKKEVMRRGEVTPTY